MRFAGGVIITLLALAVALLVLWGPWGVRALECVDDHRDASLVPSAMQVEVTTVRSRGRITEYQLPLFDCTAYSYHSVGAGD